MLTEDRVKFMPRAQLEREWQMYRDEVERLQARLEVERGPWIAEIREQMEPRIRAAEKERDELLRLKDYHRKEERELRDEIKWLKERLAGEFSDR